MPRAELVVPPIGGMRAQTMLGVNPAQLSKLRDAGLLGDERTLQLAQTPGGHWRYDETVVRELATRPVVQLPGASCDVAVHLSPLTRDTSRRGGRTHAGWSAFAEQQGLTPAQHEEAWAGWWICRPELYEGGALVGDIAGFVVEVARIVGHRLAADGRVRFEITEPTRAMRARYAGRRFRAAQGGVVQPLGATAGPPAPPTTTARCEGGPPVVKTNSPHSQKAPVRTQLEDAR